MYRCAMKRPAPVYVVTYGLGKAPVAMYTQAWRVVLCMRVLLAKGVAKNVDMFHIQRVRLAKDSELRVESTDVSECFINNVKSYGASERV